VNTVLDVGILPLRRKRLRFASQAEIADCGAACLSMVASHHGLELNSATMRAAMSSSGRGVGLRELISGADRLRMRSRPVRVGLDGLDGLVLPAILHWNMNHFVVLEVVKRKKLLIHDPAGSSRWMALSEVSSHFTGVALELEPAHDFKRAKAQTRIGIRDLWTKTRGLNAAVLQVAALTVFINIYALSAPVLLQTALDDVVPSENYSLLAVLTLGFFMFAIAAGVALLLRSTVLLAAGAALGYGISANIARRLLRLPIEWFARRSTGNVLSHFLAVQPLRKSLAEDVPTIVIDGALTLVTLVAMIRSSTLLASLSLVALALYSVVRIYLLPLQKNARVQEIKVAAREQTLLIESIQGIRSLRFGGGDTARLAAIQNSMVDSANAEIVSRRYENWEDSIRGTLTYLEATLSVWVFSYLLISGQMSLGALVAFMAYKVQFMVAATSLIGKIVDFRMLSTHLDQLSDIVLEEEDASFGDNAFTGRMLKGSIVLKNITFKHGIDEPNLFSGINLEVSPGEHIVVTGPSGQGKSTLLELILGITSPNDGSVIVDGMLLTRFGLRNYQSQIGVVLQDDKLFMGSIAENISMFDENCDYAQVYEAARVACIADEIQEMSMQYDTVVGDIDEGLSGGQRQRILLARALYRRPRMLVLDEATSHLDAALEAKINSEVNSLNITILSVAHRQETIRSASRCFNLEGGKLVEITPAPAR